jgi:hypothetical protein
MNSKNDNAIIERVCRLALRRAFLVGAGHARDRGIGCLLQRSVVAQVSEQTTRYGSSENPRLKFFRQPAKLSH